MTLGRLSIPFERRGATGVVDAEVGVNDDPAAYGCPEFARGFAWCRATVTPPARGYADALGWIQLIDWEQMEGGDGFLIDPFAPLGEVSHPFGFFGFAPTMFDAPHTDRPLQTSDFVAHSFLCGLGPEPLAGRFEADAVLGFSWGFRVREGEFEIQSPALLGPEDWDRHHDYLTDSHPGWTFLPGFT
ncbi:MAG TPA: hypothetical protein VFJ57_08545 [Solirubrobacterales bacterium]|nr:hypothetical protein [Solirubrobacterales bacterium]